VTCPCPKHPLGCYGHPHTCGCAEVTSSQNLMKLMDVIYGASSLNMTPDACSKQSRRVAKAILKQFNVSLKTANSSGVREGK
jgi:hypothetical protein